MKPFLQLLLPTALLLSASPCGALIAYVDLNSTNPVAPYSGWSTAATNIQDAIDAAAAGDVVVVANGSYEVGNRVVYGLMMNRVAINKPLTVQSVNGPAVTTITGGYIPELNRNVRCAYVTNGATLVGFTLSGGTTMSGVVSDNVREGSGGGALCESSSAAVSNCWFVGNRAGWYGGAAYSGTLYNCILSNNTAFANGGGTYGSRVVGSTLASNAVTSLQGGGGAFGGSLTNCTVIRNASYYGAGAYAAFVSNSIFSGNIAVTTGGAAQNCTIRNCTLVGNSAGSHGGGAYGGFLANSALINNVAGGSGGGAYQPAATNCTFNGNRAATSGGGVFNGTLRNSLLYHNTAPSGADYLGTTMSFCRAVPMASGPGNITNEPALASLTHLSSNSPCVAAGLSAYARGVDIDGEAWRNSPAIGCDELQIGGATGPLAVAIQADYTNVAAGLTANFTAQIVGSVSASIWDFGDATTVSNQPYASHAWGSPGDYNLTLTAFNESYPTGVVAQVVVHVVPPPIHYVSLDSTNPAPPFTNWATAATTIQDAVDAAVLGGIVLVSNGTYRTGCRAVYGSLSNRVAVSKPVTVQSLHGPLVTLIEGYQIPGTMNGDRAIRCVYLTNGASLIGFTLTNGATRTAGDGFRERSAGGIWMEQGALGAANCIIISNSAASYGGGAFSGLLSNCIFVGNSAVSGGATCSNLLRNCSLTANTASQGGAAYGSQLKNCTLAANSAGTSGGALACTLDNCIVFYNTALSQPNYSSCTLNSCCTTPLPPGGTNNMDLDPQLADFQHIAPSSPCRGVGSPAHAIGTDLDGEAWLTPPSIGCDEFVTNSALGPLSVALAPSYTNVATGFAISLTAQLGGHVASNAWNFGDGTGATNTPCAFHSWAVAGDFTVSFTAFNNDNPAGVTATTTIHVVNAPVLYVATGSVNPVSPFASWATAATNLQQAIDVASAGGSIVVTDGVYQAGIMISKPLTVRSVNGPAFTLIDGSNTLRCISLEKDSLLSGFTLTNGTAEGGGAVLCEWSSSVISNCVLVGNYGGSGGAVSGGSLYDCVLGGNSSWFGGGAYGSYLSRCTLRGNYAQAWGGGAYTCTLENCGIYDNRAYGQQGGLGGGAMMSSLNNCILSGNYCDEYGGGVAYGSLTNCILTGNIATGGGASYGATLVNCTLVGNGGGVWGGGALYGALLNCILYNNSATYTDNSDSASLSYCCIPSGGLGNITNDPALTENLFLQSNSPCINAGNGSYIAASFDVDGNQRVVAGTVDIGAREFQAALSRISYAWLQQYGFPNDGSADSSDPDHDGMNCWSEWVAGTDPTNVLSLLKCESLTTTNPPLGGFILRWQSVLGRNYFLQKATNLAGSASFSTIASNITGQAGATAFIDTNNSSAGRAFYRVGVRQ